MRVKELFKKADKQKIIQNMTSRAQGDDIDRKLLQMLIEENFREMLEDYRDCPDQDTVVVCAKYVYLDQDKEYLGVSMIKLDDLKKDICIDIFDGPDWEGMGEDDFEQKYIQGRDLIAFSWRKILGSYVADISLQEYGLDEVAEAIFNQMAFFRDEQNDLDLDGMMEEKTGRLTDFADEWEDGPEYDIPWEVVQKKLEEKGVWERKTPEKEAKRNQRVMERMERNQKESVRILEAVKRQFVNEGPKVLS